MTVWLLTAGFLPAGSWAAEETTSTSPYTAKDARDPFIPLVREGRLVNIPGATGGPMSASSLMLSGILWDPSHHSIALINDQEVTVGDTIGGYQVTAIRQDAVVLARDGQSVVLRLAFDESIPLRGINGTTRR